MDNSSAASMEGMGQPMQCNYSKCEKPYGCTGPTGGKGGVDKCDGNGSPTPNPPGTGKSK